MKKILIVLAAMLFCGNVNATAWRVCSKPEAGAHYLSVAAALADNNVVAGDTLYIEPGHLEYGNLTISKPLVIIGPGYYLLKNGINAMNIEGVDFKGKIDFNAPGIQIYGCLFSADIYIHQSISINSCYFGDNKTARIECDHVSIRNCYFAHDLAFTGMYTDALVEGNIFSNAGMINHYNDYTHSNLTIRNNTFVYTYNSTNRIIGINLANSMIYNNVIIKTATGYTTQTNSDYTVDTTFYRDMLFDDISTCTVTNNILSCHPRGDFYNCVFNAAVEDVLTWDAASTPEERYRHLPNSVAVGAGLNGVTCGAFGAANGGRAYQPAGIPPYRPYIYDAEIDDTPSDNNTINASFKIKVQE